MSTVSPSTSTSSPTCSIFSPQWRRAFLALPCCSGVRGRGLLLADQPCPQLPARDRARRPGVWPFLRGGRLSHQCRRVSPGLVPAELPDVRDRCTSLSCCSGPARCLVSVGLPSAIALRAAWPLRGGLPSIFPRYVLVMFYRYICLLIRVIVYRQLGVPVFVTCGRLQRLTWSSCWTRA